jgi:hypothetical protein
MIRSLEAYIGAVLPRVVARTRRLGHFGPGDVRDVLNEEFDLGLGRADDEAIGRALGARADLRRVTPDATRWEPEQARRGSTRPPAAGAAAGLAASITGHSEKRAARRSGRVRRRFPAVL